MIDKTRHIGARELSSEAFRLQIQCEAQLPEATRNRSPAAVQTASLGVGAHKWVEKRKTPRILFLNRQAGDGI